MIAFKRWRARFVADASGHASVITRKLGLKVAQPTLLTDSRTLFTHMVGVKDVDTVCRLLRSGKNVVTIEGLSADKIGRMVQDAWVENNVPQCGYCQAGQCMSAAALLNSKKNPSDSEIDQAMSGNICRCGCYTRIRSSIKEVAAKRGGAA